MQSSPASVRGRGRPTGPDGAREKLAKSYLTEQEKALSTGSADKHGLTESEYIRALIRRDSGLPNQLDQELMEFQIHPDAEEYKKAG